MKGISEHVRLDLTKRKLGGLDTMMSIVNMATKYEPPTTVSANAESASPTKRTQSEPAAESATETPLTKRTQFQPESTPRNAQCPCGSGQKYKRCCGKNTPPMLFAA